eukprot:TRINITY_DN21942_c0_g1_i1.p1 TRINITY_DN21942_c0_g1~~TRINITY_DN21942_c0_g1_i1.p1  ORF type:complete len:335 (-),score=54.96 TRINITY_DN21942_c0_g1_i1:42-1046(-)
MDVFGRLKSFVGGATVPTIDSDEDESAVAANAARRELASHSSSEFLHIVLVGIFGTGKRSFVNSVTPSRFPLRADCHTHSFVFPLGDLPVPIRISLIHADNPTPATLAKLRSSARIAAAVVFVHDLTRPGTLASLSQFFGAVKSAVTSAAEVAASALASVGGSRSGSSSAASPAASSTRRPAFFLLGTNEDLASGSVVKKVAGGTRSGGLFRGLSTAIAAAVTAGDGPDDEGISRVMKQHSVTRQWRVDATDPAAATAVLTQMVAATGWQPPAGKGCAASAPLLTASGDGAGAEEGTDGMGSMAWGVPVQWLAWGGDWLGAWMPCCRRPPGMET